MEKGVSGLTPTHGTSLSASFELAASPRARMAKQR